MFSTHTRNCALNHRFFSSNTFKPELELSRSEHRGTVGFYLEFLQLFEGIVAAFVGSVDVHFKLSQVQL